MAQGLPRSYLKHKLQHEYRLHTMAQDPASHGSHRGLLLRHMVCGSCVGCWPPTSQHYPSPIGYYWQ